MSTYSVAQVEAISGIRSHTLRIWERRYKFLNPMRTETNIRFYSDKELQKLITIGILTRNGHKISMIDKMTDEDISKNVTNILNSSTIKNEDEINGLTLCMLNMDEDAFNKIFQRQIIRKGLYFAITEIIYPFLNYIGLLWGTSKIIPAQEHFISNLIRQKIISATETLPLPAESAPSILLFLLEGEDHEIALLMASFLAKNIGWKVYYLGQNVPSENINTVTKIRNIDLLMTMLIAPRVEEINSVITKLTKETSIPIIISGNSENIAKIENNTNIIKVLNPEDYIKILEDRII